MGEITDYVELYIQDSGILEEFTNEFSMSLQDDIRSQLWEGHGYDQGRLKRAIRVDSRFYKKYSIVTGTWDEGLAPHGIFILAGTSPVKGKLMKMPWGYRMSRKGTEGIDFLGDGLNKTMRLYE